MRAHSISAKNFRPFSQLDELRLGPLATIVGKNDSGKSSVLHALSAFFSGKLQEIDVHDQATIRDSVEIEVSFDDLPSSIELEENVATDLALEHLVDEKGMLRIVKRYPANAPSKGEIFIKVYDFSDDRFSGLPLLKETDLNALCESLNIEYSRSGSGITNKGKRDAIREKAEADGEGKSLKELLISEKSDLWKKLSAQFPKFEMFEVDTRLSVDETSFQSQFKSVITEAAVQSSVASARDTFTETLKTAIQEEIEKIFLKFKNHTQSITSFTANPSFSWDKLVKFDLEAKDIHGVSKSVEYRGSGVRRLLMVAFFEYLAERKSADDANFIFAIEEPENCLHPGLQRELVESFRAIADAGHQVVITTHSPVFVGASPIEDLALVTRTSGRASSKQCPDLNLFDLADELEVNPSDQITGYHACVFVEGKGDVAFFNKVSELLKANGDITHTLEEKGIGLIMVGGTSLTNWIAMRCMNRISRKFAVITDSDLESNTDTVSQDKLNMKQECENQGGKFYILKKREIENYLHIDAITNAGLPVAPYDDYSDMKEIFQKKIIFNALEHVTAEQILSMDAYTEEVGEDLDENEEKHELLEIMQHLLSMAS